jgi:hypothetical protein
MTRYAFDETRWALVASWGTGRGDVAVTVADLTTSLNMGDVLDVAGCPAGSSPSFHNGGLIRLWQCRRMLV